MSYARPLLGQGRDHTYFYGDEKITEMEEDDRGGGDSPSVPRQEERTLVFLLSSQIQIELPQPPAEGGCGIQDEVKSR